MAATWSIVSLAPVQPARPAPPPRPASHVLGLFAMVNGVISIGPGGGRARHRRAVPVSRRSARPRSCSSTPRCSPPCARGTLSPGQPRRRRGLLRARRLRPPTRRPRVGDEVTASVSAPPRSSGSRAGSWCGHESRTPRWRDDLDRVARHPPRTVAARRADARGLPAGAPRPRDQPPGRKLPGVGPGHRRRGPDKCPS